MKNIKIIFHSNDSSFRSYPCIFPNEKNFYRFLDNYWNYGGFCRFQWEIDSENCIEKLPKITNSENGFIKVYSSLYPEDKISS